MIAKGEALMHYVVFDLEWNQPIRRDALVREPITLQGEIVQIGAVKLDSDFNIVDTFKIIISPMHYKIMHRKVKELTGLHTSDIKKGLSFPVAFRLFNEWCDNASALLTWGCDDMPMLKDNLAIHGMSDTVLPTHYDIQPIFDSQITKEKRQCSLTYAMEVLNEPPFIAHDALNDALSTACVCSHLDMEAGIRDYEDIVRSPKLPTIKKTFNSISEIKHDHEVCSLVCPSCKKIIACEQWVFARRGRLIGKIDCDCGERYIARLICIKNKDGSFRVARKIAERTEEDEEYYNTKRQAEKSFLFKKKNKEQETVKLG